MRKNVRTTGFTLIELMVVVIIIAALAGMVLPRVLPVSDRAKENIARGDIANISVALKLYRLENGRYPDSLDALMSRPSSAPNWNGPYLESEPIDPWGREYKYDHPGTHGKDFDLWSQGIDPQSDADNVTNWES